MAWSQFLAQAGEGSANEEPGRAPRRVKRPVPNPKKEAGIAHSKIVILGDGDFAREVYWHVQGTKPGSACLFADDHSDRKHVLTGGKSIDVIKDWRFPSGFDRFVVGIGDPKIKRLAVDAALSEGLIPADPIVHPRALVQDPECRLGRGGVVTPGCVLTTNVSLGDYVILNLNTTIGHDTIIGDYCTLNPGCQVSGSVVLGQSVTLGTGTVVREGIEIADGVMSGAQACIVSPIEEAGATVVGVPARKLAR